MRIFIKTSILLSSIPTSAGFFSSSELGPFNSELTSLKALPLSMAKKNPPKISCDEDDRKVPRKVKGDRNFVAWQTKQRIHLVSSSPYEHLPDQNITNIAHSNEITKFNSLVVRRNTGFEHHFDRNLPHSKRRGQTWKIFWAFLPTASFGIFAWTMGEWS